MYIMYCNRPQIKLVISEAGIGVEELQYVQYSIRDYEPDGQMWAWCRGGLRLLNGWLNSRLRQVYDYSHWWPLMIDCQTNHLTAYTHTAGAAHCISPNPPMSLCVPRCWFTQNIAFSFPLWKNDFWNSFKIRRYLFTLEGVNNNCKSLNLLYK